MARMPDSFNALPAELLQNILSYLPIASLLSFARTSKSNYSTASHCLHVLELAVFPRQVHTTLAFLEEGCRESTEDLDEDSEHVSTLKLSTRRRKDAASSIWSRDGYDKELYTVGILSQPPRVLSSKASKSSSKSATKERRPRSGSRSAPVRVSRPWSQSPESPVELRTQEIMKQNAIARDVLTAPSLSNLKSLTLHIYDILDPSLTSALAASFPNLQHLCLNFCHPYIYDTMLPPRYWRETPRMGTGSPVWNELSGIGQGHSPDLQLRNLRSLTLRRCSITSFQLRSWIQANTSLRSLYLEKVRGVDQEFCTWLGAYVAERRSAGNGTMMKITLEDCGELRCENEKDFDWIATLTGTVARPRERNVDPFLPASVSTAPPARKFEYLSLKSCASVNEDVFLRLAGIDPTTLNSTIRDSSSRSFSSSSSLLPPSPSFQKSPQTLSHQQRQWSVENTPTLISPKGVIIRGDRILHLFPPQPIRRANNNNNNNGGRTGSSSPPPLPFSTSSDGIDGAAAATTPFYIHDKGMARDNIDDIKIEVDPDM